MSHTPPVPAANQSPFPRQEPPHAKAPPAPPAPPPGDKRIARTPDRVPTPGTPTLIAVAAGVGLAAIAGGLFYALRAKPKPKAKKRKAKSQA